MYNLTYERKHKNKSEIFHRFLKSDFGEDLICFWNSKSDEYDYSFVKIEATSFNLEKGERVEVNFKDFYIV